MFNAVLFGSNYKGSEMELNGCINDTDYWTDVHKFSKVSAISVLKNDDMTKASMVEALEEMTDKTPDNGLQYVNYSGHGTIVPPGVQAWVPDDFDWDDQDTWLTYDEIDRILMKHEKRGVLVAVISDSCHSKADPRLHFRNLESPKKTKNRFLEPPEHIKSRIVSSPFNRNVLSVDQDDVLLSGCRKDQTSADAYIGGSYHGAFTYAMSTILDLYLAGKISAPTYQMLILKARAWLAMHGYDQVPGADGDPKILDLPLFKSIPQVTTRGLKGKRHERETRK